MDRLTKLVDGVWIENHDRDTRHWKNGNRACMDRLAAYEDTGLKPEEVAALQAQLAESQRREKVAVEALSRIRRDIYEPDKIYIHVSDYFGRWQNKQEA